MHPIRLASAAAALLLAAAWAPADAVDAVVSLGTLHTGEVPAGGAPVVVGVLVPGGAANCSMQVKATRGSTLVPQVALVLPDGTVKDADDFLAEGATVRATARAVTISRIPALGTTGLHKLLVTGADGIDGKPTAGGFTVRLKGRPSRGFKNPISTISPSTEKENFTIRAPENGYLTLKIKPSFLTPFGPSLQILTAEGDTVNYGEYLTVGRDDSISVRNLPLPFFGDYTLRVGSSAGTGDYTMLVKLKGRRVPVIVPGVPVAEGGGVGVVEPGAAGALDGSGTSNAVSYQWVRVSGTPITLSGRTSNSPTFTAPSARGTWAWQLVARNPSGTSLPSLAIVEVDRVPVANAGPSRSVAVGTPVTLDGSGSLDLDPGDVLRHAWTQVSGPAATLDDPFAAQPSFAPSTAGTYVFGLVVDDGTARSSRDTVVVVAGGDGPAPDAGRTVFVRPQDSVFLSALRSLSAAGGPPAAWAWSADGANPVAVTLAGSDTAVASFTAPKQRASLRFRLSVDGGAAQDEVLVVVSGSLPENLSPEARAGTRQTVVQGATFVLDGSGSTDDASVQSHEWGQVGGPDAGLEPSGASATGTAPLSDAVLRFWLMAHDGRKYGPPDQVVVVSGTQTTPLADAGTDRSGFIGQTITLSSAGSLPAPGQTLVSRQWTQVSGTDWYDVDLRDDNFDPAAASPQILVPTNVSSLTPTRPLHFALTVTDGSGTSEADLVAVTFTDLQRNAPPEVTASTTASVFRPGASVVLSATTMDGDGDPISHSWQQIAGPVVTLAPATNPQVTVTAPTASDTLVFRVTVNDGTGEPNATDTADVSFSVNRPPVVVVSADPMAGPEGTLVTLSGAGTSDPDDASPSFQWTEIPPQEGSTVTLSGADTQTATFTQPSYAATGEGPNKRKRTFVLTVTDSFPSGSVSAQVNFFPNRPPVLDPISAGVGDRKIFHSNSLASSDKSETLTAASSGGTAADRDADGDLLTWAWRIVSGPFSNPPSSYLSSTSARVVTFAAPKPNQSLNSTGGVYVLGVTASDGAELSAEATVQVLVTPSFASDVYPMFQGTCTSGSCHGAFSAGFLRLDQGASTTRSNLLNGRVTANDHANSLLYTKLNSGLMPKTGSPPWTGSLQFQTNIIRDWIEPEHNGNPGTLSSGAENN